MQVAPAGNRACSCLLALTPFATHGFYATAPQLGELRTARDELAADYARAVEEARRLREQLEDRTVR